MAFKLVSVPGLVLSAAPVVCPICRYCHELDRPCLTGMPEWRLYEQTPSVTIGIWDQVKITTTDGSNWNNLGGSDAIT